MNKDELKLVISENRKGKKPSREIAETAINLLLTDILAFGSEEVHQSAKKYMPALLDFFSVGALKKAETEDAAWAWLATDKNDHARFKNSLFSHAGRYIGLDGSRMHIVKNGASSAPDGTFFQLDGSPFIEDGAFTPNVDRVIPHKDDRLYASIESESFEGTGEGCISSLTFANGKKGRYKTKWLKELLSGAKPSALFIFPVNRDEGTFYGIGIETETRLGLLMPIVEKRD